MRLLMSKETSIRHIEALRTAPLNEILKEQTFVSDSVAQDLIMRGSIWVNFIRTRENSSVEQGTYIRAHTEPRRFPADKIDWKKTLVHDDDDFILIKKPAGIPVHPTVDNWVENCIYSLEQTLGYPVFVTQRLDTPTEGLLILAKTKYFQSQFNRILRERKIKKLYKAMTEHPVPTGELVHYMEPSLQAPKTVSPVFHEGWQECRLIVQSCTPIEINNKSLYQIDIELLTGRTHQIRAQLAAIGAPLLGDSAYGSTADNPWKPLKYEISESIALRADQLLFKHPMRQLPYHFICP